MLSKHKKTHRSPKIKSPMADKVYRFRIILLALLIAASTAFAPIIQSSNVSALSTSIDDPTSYDSQIKSLLLYGSVSWCIANDFGKSTVVDYGFTIGGQGSTDHVLSLSDAKNGSWFGVASNKHVSPGAYMSGQYGIGNDGITTCDNSALVTGALSSYIWNLNPVNVLCSIGLQFYIKGSTTTKNGQDCIDYINNTNGADGYFMLKEYTNTNIDKVAASFASYVRDNVYHNSGNPKLSTEQSYIYYRQIVKNKCISSIGSTGNTGSVPNGNGFYGDVKWVAWSGSGASELPTHPLPASPTTYWYQGIDKDNSIRVRPYQSIQDGANLDTSYNADNSGTEETCKTLVSWMNNDIQPYLTKFGVAWEKSNPDLLSKTVVDPNGSNKEIPTGTKSCSIDGVGWIICPVVNFLANIADKSFVFLSNNFLSTSPAIFTNTALNSEGKNVNPTFEAWSAMRNIANIAFVIAFMVIIFSQITNYGIDNYGIKKILPRLIIAAILVNVSYYICQIAVDISNILGYSLKSFLAGLAPSSTVHPGWGSGSNWVGTSADILGAAAIAWASLGVLIPAVLAAIVSLVMILFLLTARQALIILLVVISPLAFVAFLLPNTNDWYKKWQKAFVGMLMLFPIIAVVFGTSTLASTILGSVFDTASNSDYPTLGKIIAAVVLVVPLFIVPSLLKKSLDGVGGIGAKLNGIGDKLGGALGKKGSEWYDNTPVARGRAERKQYRQSYRDQRYAENLSKGGLTKSLAKGLRGRFSPLAADKFANERLDSYAAANANDLDEKAVNNKSAQMRRDLGPGNLNGAQTSLIQAIEEGDSVSARAAMRLLKVNNTGRNLMAEAIQGAKVTEKNEKTLSNMKSEALTYGLKGQNILLDKWASNATYDVKDANGNVVKDANGKNVKESYATINDISAGENIFEGLNDTELAGQSEKLIASNEANFKKVVNRDTANRILSNANLVKDMNPKNRALLEQIARQSGVGRGPNDGNSGGFIL